MNQKQIQIRHKEFKDQLTNECTMNRKGCSKCWKGVTNEHYIVMSNIVWWLVNQGYDVFTEAEFKKGGRADIVCWISGQAFAIEVLHTETDERYEAKFDKYPEDFTMVKIKTGGFDISSFVL